MARADLALEIFRFQVRGPNHLEKLPPTLKEQTLEGSSEKKKKREKLENPVSKNQFTHHLINVLGTERDFGTAICYLGRRFFNLQQNVAWLA